MFNFIKINNFYSKVTIKQMKTKTHAWKNMSKTQFVLQNFPKLIRKI